MGRELHHNAEEGEIDLREFLYILWKGKWAILATTVIFSLVGVVYSLSKPDVYEASALLAPVEREGKARIGGQITGLASLAGVSLSGEKTSRTAIAVEVLQSRAFLSNFIRRHHLSVPLMATSGWDFENRQWQYDLEVYDPADGEWREDESGDKAAPSDWELVRAFRSQLSVREDQKNGLITVAFNSTSPQAAADWVGLLLDDINEHMRNKDIEEAEASIAYLESKLTETNIAGMRQVFYQLIESETRTVMLANASQEYVFQTLDPAVASEEKSGPKRALIVATTAIVGLILGIFITFIWAFVRAGKDKP